MKNTDHITEWIEVEFEGKTYPVREVHIKSFGDRYIATKTLENILMPNDEYASDDARDLDERIFFYVEDKYINYDDKKLAKYVEENVI